MNLCLSHINNQQQWVVGLINLSNNNLRIELVNDRRSDTLKKKKFILALEIQLIVICDQDIIF